MSRHHTQMLRTIFQDPPSGNIHWREIESLLKHVGASIEPASKGRIHIKLGRADSMLHRPHHGNTLDSRALLHLREILARGGVTPSAYEAAQAAKGAESAA